MRMALQGVNEIGVLLNEIGVLRKGKPGMGRESSKVSAADNLRDEPFRIPPAR
jgi:hypothetical protein